MSHFLSIKKTDDWFGIKHKSKNLLIIRKAYSKDIAPGFKLHPFQMKWVKNRANYFNTPNDFCPIVENFMGRMVSNFALVAKSKQFILKLEKITDGSCRAFHSDNLNLRLICTLDGPGGTQWANNDNVNYKLFNSHNVQLLDADKKNSLIIKDLSEINTADIGDVLIMKGTCGNSEHALIHRSFPLQEQDNARWVFTISEKFSQR